MKYVIFNKESKRVLQWLDTDAKNYNLPDASMLHECSEAEWALDHALEWMIQDGAIVPYTETVDIDLLKALKIAGISEAFTNATKAGFITDYGLTMNADISDVQRLKSAYDLALLLEQATLPIVVDYYNVAHENLPVAEVLSMIIDLGVNYQMLYAKKQNLRSQAMAATTETELDLITWS